MSSYGAAFLCRHVALPCVDRATSASAGHKPCLPVGRPGTADPKFTSKAWQCVMYPLWQRDGGGAAINSYGRGGLSTASTARIYDDILCLQDQRREAGAEREQQEPRAHPQQTPVQATSHTRLSFGHDQR